MTNSLISLTRKGRVCAVRVRAEALSCAATPHPACVILRCVLSEAKKNRAERQTKLLQMGFDGPNRRPIRIGLERAGQGPPLWPTFKMVGILYHPMRFVCVSARVFVRARGGGEERFETWWCGSLVVFAVRGVVLFADDKTAISGPSRICCCWKLGSSPPSTHDSVPPLRPGADGSSSCAIVAFASTPTAFRCDDSTG